MTFLKLVEKTPVLRSLYWRIAGRRRAQSELQRWSAMPPQDVFAEIYQTNHWSDPESRSGTGSTLRETETLRAALPGLLARRHIASIADIPCGDFNWLSRVNLGDVRYVGGDIVPALIESNRVAYTRDGVRFITCNLITDHLPEADLLFVRDCLVHLSFRDTAAVMRNILASPARFLFTTSFTAETSNRDITTGDWRMINLQLPPYGLPPPLEVIREKPGAASTVVESKSMCLWDLAVLRRLPSVGGAVPSAPR